MTVVLELLDRDGTPIKTIAQVIEGSAGWNVPWIRRSKSAGSGTFNIANDHADWDDIAGTDGWFRIVRCYLNPADPEALDPETADFAFQIVRATYRRLGDSHEEVTQVYGPGAFSLLGLREWHSATVVDPYGRGFRVFGWIAEDFDDTAWTSPHPHSGGQQRRPRLSSRRGRPDGWPDDELAEWLWGSSSSPSGEFWSRHVLAGSEGEATLYLSGPAKAYFDGEEVLESGSHRDTVSRRVTLEESSLLAVQAQGEAMWTIIRDGQVLFRSTTGTPFSEAENEVQSIVLDPDTPPFPWGSSYPSPGGLEGTWRITFRGQQTGAIQWDADASGVKSALEALPNIDEVTVTGDGTSGSPWVVEFDGEDVEGRSHPLMTLEHTDLRHDHATTRVRRVNGGQTTAEATPGSDAIRSTFTEPEGVTWGLVMDRVLTEAQDRGCLPGVTWNFDEDVDSTSVPWSTSLPYVSYRDGVQLGDVALQGLQQFDVDCEMLPTLELAGYDTLGDDLTGTVQYVDGTGSAAAATVDAAAPKATVGRVETSGGFGWVEDVAQVGEYGRRESGVTFGLAETVEEVNTATEQFLRDVRGKVPQTIQSVDLQGARPADTVGVRERDGGPYEPARIVNVAVQEVEGGHVEFDVDVERLL